MGPVVVFILTYPPNFERRRGTNGQLPRSDKEENAGLQLLNRKVEQNNPLSLASTYAIGLRGGKNAHGMPYRLLHEAAMMSWKDCQSDVEWLLLLSFQGLLSPSIQCPFQFDPSKTSTL